MLPKSDPAHVTQLATLQFLTTNSARAEFAFDNNDLQLHVEAHAPGVFRIRCAQAARLNDQKPSLRAKAQADMLLARHEPVGELTVSSMTEEGQAGWQIEQGEVVLRLTASPLQLSFYRGDHCVLRTNALAPWEVEHHDDGLGWRISLALDPDDALHGLGETVGDLDRKGQQFVSDSPDSRYLPLTWSPLGWGLYVNTFGRVEHDAGREDADSYNITWKDRVLDCFVFIGEPAEVVNQYTALTGRAGQPGLWPMGVWVDQPPGQTVDATLQQAQSLRDEGFPFDAVQLSTPSLVGFQSDKPALEWDAERIADPRAMLGKFQALNAQVVAPTFPAVLANTELFDEWEDRGWLLINDEDGSAHVFPGNEFSGGSPFGLLDLTNKDVYRLWSEKQNQLAEEGLGAPVCDAQLDIPDGITARGGETGAVLRTLYPLLARRALFDAVAGHKTPQEGVVCSTDLFPAVQRFAWQLGPEVGNDWSGLEQSLRAALSLGDSGVPMLMHRLGSAREAPQAMNAALYLRWLAMCVFSGNFSLQAHPALLPTAFDEPTRELIRHWFQWRYRLVPYVLGIIEDSVRTGLPVQRSMALSFPHDFTAHAWDSQYLLGPALLVAPVLQPGNEVRVYLPEGDAWWDLNTGWRYEGGTTCTVEVGLDTIPVFGREGHMLCVGPAAQHTGEFNSARILDEVWMFGMPEHNPVVMRNKIRVMQMQGSSYIKGLEGLRILPAEGLEVKRRGAEVRISRAR